MSQYSIDQGEYRVTVGWSQSRATYTMHVYSLKALAEVERLEQMWLDSAVETRGHDSLIDQIAEAEADAHPMCCRGTTYREISTTAGLVLAAKPYAELPPDVISRLIADYLHNPPEIKPIDQFIKRLIDRAKRHVADHP